jgi:hypothetical protein
MWIIMLIIIHGYFFRDTLHAKGNQVWRFKVEIINFGGFFKPWVHEKFAFPALQGNSDQQKSGQIKDLHLYTYCIDASFGKDSDNLVQSSSYHWNSVIVLTVVEPVTEGKSLHLHYI